MSKWSKELIIIAIQDFYSKYNRSPKAKDFTNNSSYPAYRTVFNYFDSWNSALIAAGLPINRNQKKPKYWTREEIIITIQNFHNIHKRLPKTRDFVGSDFPSNYVIINHFDSWNNAIMAAGFEPNLSNILGIATYSIDGNLYRSKAEAYFVDKFLFSKYEYEIEPKYPPPYNKYYDWYIPSLNLYIELDGGLRPNITEEKIAINKLLGRDCLFITTDSIYKYNKLTDFIKK